MRTEFRKKWAERYLERASLKASNMPTVRGIPISEFDQQHLVMACKLFANKWAEYQERYFNALDRSFPSQVSAATPVAATVTESQEGRTT